MEPTQSSETSAFNTQTPGKYPEDNLSLLRHGESLKTRSSCMPRALPVTLTYSLWPHYEFLPRRIRPVFSNCLCFPFVRLYHSSCYVFFPKFSPWFEAGDEQAVSLWRGSLALGGEIFCRRNEHNLWRPQKIVVWANIKVISYSTSH
jgi:hypothetical protein